MSYHFITGRAAGQAVQIVDTNDAAWAQRSGNPNWISVGNEGFTSRSQHYRSGWERLTVAQLDVCAAVLARAHRDHGVPLQVAHSPAGRGLGYHRMGWPAWGDPDCPGDTVVSQLAEIVRRANLIVGGLDMDEATLRRIVREESARAPVESKLTGDRVHMGAQVAWGHFRAREARDDIRDRVLPEIRALAEGVGAGEVVDRIEALAAEATAERAAMLKLLQRSQSGELDAAAVVDELARRLGGDGNEASED